MNSDITYFQVILETLITFFILLLYTRLLGKKQMSHLTFFNYITGITIGSIAANMVISPSLSFFKEIVALSIWCLLTVVIGYLTLKSSKLRIILDGQPTIIIKRGKILRKSLKSLKMNLDDISMLLREQNIFSIRDVDYAILEPNGKISVLKKVNKQPTTREDLNIIVPAAKYLPTEIIVDGKFVTHSLKELNLTKEWVIQQLNQIGISSIKSILYAEIQDDGSIFVNID